MSRPPSGALERRTISVGGANRTYWLAPQPAPEAPLLMVLHAMGINGPNMAAWTGLAVRGPAAGFATVFPDAVAEIWDDTGSGRVDGLDDAAFVSSVTRRLVAEGTAAPGAVFLAGLSNGAFFAERLARHGLVQASGLALVAGTARQTVLCIEGTKDPLLPYGGGRGSGMFGWMARRRARRQLVQSHGRVAVGAETLAGDWAAANGGPPRPTTEILSVAPGDLHVDRLTWATPGHAPVVLYRIDGGGHGWPGGPQYMPALFVGRIAQSFDATGILLEFALQTVRAVPPTASH
ncbi:MAG: alpha/beta hydrolase family esterase [Candidatus Dormibacteraceae bacterium]